MIDPNHVSPARFSLVLLWDGWEGGRGEEATAHGLGAAVGPSACLGLTYVHRLMNGDDTAIGPGMNEWKRTLVSLSLDAPRQWSPPSLAASAEID